MKTVAVILAAGDGAKVGCPEANLEYEKGRSFLKWLSSTFNKLGVSSIAVVKPGAEDIKERHPDALLIEGSPQEGFIRAGIRAALDEGADIIVLHPVERPAVRSSTIDKLLKSVDGVDGVVPDFEGAVGQPVILKREAAERILRMDGDPQLAQVLKMLELRHVSTKDPGVLVNIDTPEMYERLLGKKPQPAPMPKKRGKKAAEA